MSISTSTTALAWTVAGALAALCGSACAAADRTGHDRPAARASHGHRVEHSGRRQLGKASVYARKFAGRKMANGERMDPADDNAASKTLPLGTTARVTNLENGKSTVVTIEDRGPHVPGRIVDLSPGSAAKLGVTRKEGVAPVAVEPIAVPQPDGSVKPGAGAK